MERRVRAEKAPGLGTGRSKLNNAWTPGISEKGKNRLVGRLAAKEAVLKKHKMAWLVCVPQDTAMIFEHEGP